MKKETKSRFPRHEPPAKVKTRAASPEVPTTGKFVGVGWSRAHLHRGWLWGNCWQWTPESDLWWIGMIFFFFYFSLQVIIICVGWRRSNDTLFCARATEGKGHKLRDFFVFTDPGRTGTKGTNIRALICRLIWESRRDCVVGSIVQVHRCVMP